MEFPPSNRKIIATRKPRAASSVFLGSVTAGIANYYSRQQEPCCFSESSRVDNRVENHGALSPGLKLSLASIPALRQGIEAQLLKGNLARRIPSGGQASPVMDSPLDKGGKHASTVKEDFKEKKRKKKTEKEETNARRFDFDGFFYLPRLKGGRFASNAVNRPTVRPLFLLEKKKKNSLRNFEEKTMIFRYELVLEQCLDTSRRG